MYVVQTFLIYRGKDGLLSLKLEALTLANEIPKWAAPGKSLEGKAIIDWWMSELRFLAGLPSGQTKLECI